MIPPTIHRHILSPLESSTHALGAWLGARAWAGLDIRLEGGLGAGKTVFARGLAEGLGIDEVLTSPTFPIIQEYRGRLPLYHMDWYRLGSEDEVLETGAAELLSGDGLCLVEWPDRALELFGPGSLRVSISILDGARGLRRISLSGPEALLAGRLAWPQSLPPGLAAALEESIP